MTVRKAFFNVLGTIFVGLGIAGIILPLVPATPFLLLASACYVRGSDRLHDWLMNHRHMGPYLRNFKEHRAMPMQAKIATIALLWTSVAISAFTIDHIHVQITLVVIAIGTTTYVARMRTLGRPETVVAAETEPAVPASESI